jgi:hypothetical protein
MSRTYTLCLDTRTRSEGEIWNPTFQLSKPISRIKSARIRCVQFGNTLYNIKQGENVLSMLSGSSVVLPPGFYRADELITKLRLVVDVTYDSTTGLLTWNIQVGSINFVHTTLQEILGLNGQVSTGQFVTRLFLASPMNVDFVSPQLMNSSGAVVYGYRSSDNYQPFVTVPIASGYGVMNVYLPMNMPSLQLGDGSLSTMSVVCLDNEDGRLLKEMVHWSMIIEVDCY